MSKSINVEITTQEQRDQLIEQLQEMSFDKEVKNWEELNNIQGWFTNNMSNVRYATTDTLSVNLYDYRNTWATKEQAKASLAMAQLSQLIKFYNDGWEPDWTDGSYKYTIVVVKEKPVKDIVNQTNKFLVFKTEKIRDKFLTNHSDLINQAKPLL
jgi:hypothetical protein